VESDPLLLQFADSHPDELAGLLADAGPGELAELLNTLPLANSTRLAARLPSRALSQLLAQQADQVTGDMLLAAKHDDAVALVSHLQESRYAAILDACPRKKRKRLERLFEFPSLSLSSLASPEFIRVSCDALCESISLELQAYRDTHPRPIFAVDSNGTYQGMVNALALIARKNRKLQVRAITEFVPPLSGDLGSAAARESPEWLKYLALPVTDSHQRIIGAITREQLQRFLPDTGAARGGLELILSELAEGYLDFCAEMMRSLLTRPPR
jgi:magnesium transporter